MSCTHCDGPVPLKVPGRPGPQRTTCDTCKVGQAQARGRRRYVTTGAMTRPSRWQHRPGQRFGELVMLDRDSTRGTFQCDCGREVNLQLNNVTRGQITRCSNREAHPDPRRIEDAAVGYETAHTRVKVARGPARNHSCTLCGARAKDWAFAYTAAVFRIGAPGRSGEGMPYSTDPSDYVPLCRPCHKRMDGSPHATTRGPSLPHVALFMLLTAEDDDEGACTDK